MLADPLEIVDTAPYPPFACVFCNNIDGPFIDTGVEIGGAMYRSREEMEAGLTTSPMGDRGYQCVLCVGRCAETLGWQNPDSRERVRIYAQGLEARVAELEVALAAAIADRVQVVSLADALKAKTPSQSRAKAASGA